MNARQLKSLWKRQSNILPGIVLVVTLVTGIWIVVRQAGIPPDMSPSAIFMQQTSGYTLVLEAVLIDDQRQSPFLEDQSLIIHTESSLSVQDGCNRWSYPGIIADDGVPLPYDGNGDFWSYAFLQTLRGCADPVRAKGSEAFGVALRQVIDFEIRDDEVWLFYGDEGDSVLIFGMRR